MSLIYWPAACQHCACLGAGGRCCYCRFTRGMVAALPQPAEAAIPEPKPPLNWPQLDPRWPMQRNRPQNAPFPKNLAEEKRAR